MASHPDELYSSLNKLCWYCEDEFSKSEELFNKMSSSYFRHWLYLPILLINDDLYELTVENNNSSLKKVLSSKILYNFYYDDVPTSTIVYVVTKNHLKDFLQKMNDFESNIAEKMKNSF